MPDYGYGALALGSGAGEGLATLLKQRLMERAQQLAELTQQQTAAHNAQQLAQQGEDIAARRADTAERVGYERGQDALTRGDRASAAAERGNAVRLSTLRDSYAPTDTITNPQDVADASRLMPGLVKLRPAEAGTAPLIDAPWVADYQGDATQRRQVESDKRSEAAAARADAAGARADASGKRAEAMLGLAISKSAGAASAEPTVELAGDPESRNVLSQTGLNMNAFYWITGQGGKLSRDAATRTRAGKDAEAWSRRHNVDVSTLPSQYKTYNDVLGANISRLNNTKIMEQELQGTIENLQGVVKQDDLSKLRVANVMKIWAGQEVNDDLAQQYALHLGQLRNELAAYYAATQGRTGNNIMLSDERDAERIIRNGLSRGSLDGLATAITNSTSKMGTVMGGSVDRARKSIWDLFGVGQNYKDTAGGGGAPAPKVIKYDLNGNVIR
jgi:hypothetical protein